jgi:hypothetical protein
VVDGFYEATSNLNQNPFFEIASCYRRKIFMDKILGLKVFIFPLSEQYSKYCAQCHSRAAVWGRNYLGG